MRGGGDQIKEDGMERLGKILTNGQVRNSHSILGRELKGGKHRDRWNDRAY
jgi:hypothetical protein